MAVVTENTAFSSSGQDAITQSLDVVQDLTTKGFNQEQFDEYYEIRRTVDEIVAGDFKRIALQFPDELLHDSVPVFRRLTAFLEKERQVYVLADTSYGSCCVDEVAAQHVDADAIVHYGHACLSQTARLPVVYIFGKRQLDVDKTVEGLVGLYLLHHPEVEDSAVVLRHDVVYNHLAEALQSKFADTMKPHAIKVHYTPIPTYAGPAKATSPPPPPPPPSIGNTTTTNTPPTSSSPLPNLDASPIFYIGGESLSLTNLLMTHASCEVYVYDPQQPPRAGSNPRLESAKTNRLLMRRYAMVQKARDADVFGILVGTLGVASYLPLLAHLRALLKQRHKKSYTISVGKLNPAKLANFMEIECFVLVACPENSLIDAKDFYRPIVTPFELEIALRREPSWSGKYLLDFARVIGESIQPALKHTSDANAGTGANSNEDVAGGEGDKGKGEEEDGEYLDRPVFSLVTGTYRHAKRYNVQDDSAAAATATATGASESADQSLVVRNQESAVANVMKDSAAGHYLNARSWKGLEVRYGQDAPSVVEEGRRGIARGYGELQEEKKEVDGKYEESKETKAAQ